MTHGSQFALVSESEHSNGRVLDWAVATPAGQTRTGGSMALTGMSRDRAALMQVTTEARIALEEAVVAAAEAAQRAISYAEILDDALADLQVQSPTQRPAVRAASRAPETTVAVAALSPREREVLALVAEGCSNKAIAETLYVSPNTIKTHISSLLVKLHAESRAQLAAIAVRGAVR